MAIRPATGARRASRPVAPRRSLNGRRPAIERLEPRTLLDGAGPYLFDFGTAKSAVASGYTQVAGTLYADQLGYGWDTTVYMKDKGSVNSDPLIRDLNHQSARTFRVNVPVGVYDVTPTLGDPKELMDNVALRLEGALVESNISTAAGKVFTKTYRVPVEDGRLDVRLTDDGGKTGNWAIDALVIRPVPGTLTVDAGADRTADEGAPVAFSGTATGVAPLTYQWDFGDGTTAVGTLQSVHAYADNGTYLAVLTVTDGMGRTSSDSLTVRVSNVAPTASAGGPYAAEAGAPLRLTASAVDPSPIDQAAGFTYSWTFGDGTTGSGVSPTHTYASPGTYTAAVKATDKDGGTSVLALATVVISAATSGSIVPIDANWLAARGAGPYSLDKAGTTYRLMTDVSVEGTAFQITANGVTLDLNGHTVTYDQSAPILVPNGGFEAGARPSDVPGWDLSGAPSAVRAPAITGMWGDWGLRLNNISTPQSIVSSPIQIPKAGIKYAAAVTAKGPFGSKVTLSVIDAVTGAILASSALDPGSGPSLVASFTPATSNNVRLRIEAAPESGKTAIVDLDYAAVYRADIYGVKAEYKENVTVKNGTILQGTGRSYQSSPIWFYQHRAPFTIDGVEARASGMDTNVIYGNWAPGATIRNSRLIGDVDRIANRHAAYAVVYLLASKGTIVVENNQLSGSHQNGIVVSGGYGISSFDRIAIRGNDIRLDSSWTNSYAIGLGSWSRNFEVSNNTIVPVSGRGIMLDPGEGGRVMESGTVHDNYVEVRERPNIEYGTASTAIALRVRTWRTGGAIRNVRIHDNTFMATTGDGYVDWADGAMISVRNPTGAMTDANLLFENNLFKGILLQDNGQRAAYGMTVSGADAGTGTVFRNNVFESNHTSLDFGDKDSYADIEEGLDFIGNTIRKSNEGITTTHRGIVAGDWNVTVRDVRLIDMRYENGATPGIMFVGSAAKSLSTGWLVDVMVTDSAGNRLAGANVTLRYADGTVAYSGASDAQGLILGIPVATDTWAVSAMGDNSRPTRTTRKNLTVGASLGTLTGTAVIVLDGNAKVTISLGK
jgi:chitodextrinase